MYVCMYVCMHACMYVCMYVCIIICMHIFQVHILITVSIFLSYLLILVLTTPLPADLEEFTCQCKKRWNSKIELPNVEASDVDDLKRSIESLQEKVMLLESHTYCRYDGEIYPPGSVWITEGLSCSCKVSVQYYIL